MNDDELNGVLARLTGWKGPFYLFGHPDDYWFLGISPVTGKEGRIPCPATDHGDALRLLLFVAAHESVRSFDIVGVVGGGLGVQIYLIGMPPVEAGHDVPTRAIAEACLKALQAIEDQTQ